MSHHLQHANHSASEHALVRETTTPDGQVRHQNEQNSRAPVEAPEADATLSRPEPKAPESGLVAQPDAPLMPPPVAPTLPKAPQSVATEVTPAENKDVRTRAEEALAAYVGQHLNEELKQGLQLDVLPVVGYGQTGIKLCFHGPHVTTHAPMLNDMLIGHQCGGPLAQHPVLKKFFQNAAELPKIDVPSDGSNMYHITIPMTVEMYQNTLKELAGDTVAQAPVAAAEMAPAAEVAAVPETATPQAMVQAPVAALDKVVSNDIAQGVAH